MMPKTPNPTLNRQILEEASDWFVDFRVGDVDAAAGERFDEWLRRSPEHIRAYWEIATTYVELPSLAEASKLDVDALIAYAHSDGNVVPISAGAPRGETRVTAQDALGTERATRHPVRRRRIIAAAACLFVATIAAAFWWQDRHYPRYSTDVGERRSLTLADGSTVDLDARSSIRVEFSSAERRIELLDGQALFQVAKNRQRPFVVRSGEATARAVGTEFSVYRRSSGTTITVLEGRVAVYTGTEDAPAHSSRPVPQGLNPSRRDLAQPRAPGAGGGAPALPAVPAGPADPVGGAAVLLSAGEQVTVTPAAAVAAPQHVDLTATTAWMQRPLMILDGTKLSDVVEEFNRYNHRQLVIESAKLSDFRVSGVYSSTDPASLLRFLREQPGIRIIESDAEVRITPQ